MNEIINSTNDAGYPLLPMRGLSIFPGMLINFDVIRPKSVAALNSALEANRMIFIVAQRDITKEIPSEHDLFTIGTICRVKQLLRIPGTEGVRVLVEGFKRAKIKRFEEKEEFYYADVAIVEDSDTKNSSAKAEALIRQCLSLFNEYAHLFGALPPELLTKIADSDKPGYVADFIAQNIYMKPEKKQALLEELNPLARVALLNRFLAREIAVLSIEQDLTERTHEQMTKSQKEFFLREQLKVIQQELGIAKDDRTADGDRFRERLTTRQVPEPALKRINEELDKLAILETGSPEYAVTRNYLDALTDLPWGVYSTDNLDLKHAREVLDRDHDGLEDVKDRIIEFLAVGALKGQVGGSIILLVGPPGVGKTSIGRSVAAALDRKFYRLSLGGMRDEAEIKGHRRTYIGALPGKFIQAIREAGTANPVIMLDEIDKVGASYRGDPASALLEVLDPEQNNEFLDHYLDVRFDLSKVLFICTANQLDTIPGPLLDRMETTRLSGYITAEKLQIARNHLWPKLLERSGMARDRIQLEEPTLRQIIEGYAREAGVRNLEKQLGRIVRKTAVDIVNGREEPIAVEPPELDHYLGKPPFKSETPMSGIGVVTGLAWTAMGGATLNIEATRVHTKNRGFKLTGRLGEVMQESANIAYSYVSAHLEEYQADPKFFDEAFVHLHVPEGATPKDGPSAGITMATALLSLARGQQPDRLLAMTGELTLTGLVLPVGGIREKAIAARRVGIHELILPEANRGDVEELPDHIKEGLTIHFVERLRQVVETVFVAKALEEPEIESVEHGVTSGETVSNVEN